MANLKRPFFSITATKNKAPTELSRSLILHCGAKKPGTETSKKPRPTHNVSTELVLFDSSWLEENVPGIEKQSEATISLKGKSISCSNVSTETEHYLGAKPSYKLSQFNQSSETENMPRTEEVHQKVDTGKQSRAAIFPEDKSSFSAVPEEVVLYGKTMRIHCLAEKVPKELLLFGEPWGTRKKPRTEDVQIQRKSVETGKQSRVAIFPEEKNSYFSAVPEELVLFGKTLRIPCLDEKELKEFVLFGEPCDRRNPPRTGKVQQKVETEKQSTSTTCQEDKTSSASSSFRNVPIELNLFDKSCTTKKRKITPEKPCMSNSTGGRWKLRKQLTRSDVGDQCRLLLDRNFVKDHVFTSMSKEFTALVKENQKGAKVKVWDEDKKTEHELVLKLWPSSKSYVLVSKWAVDFVKRRELKKGDEVGLYWDCSKTRFCFSVLNRIGQGRGCC